ncbi:MAG: hypothetical protein KA354_17940 [Phycisphaerae bacterium]|nr:hypothetical protein [Phycisphaerae bacterium]
MNRPSAAGLVSAAATCVLLLLVSNMVEVRVGQLKPSARGTLFDAAPFGVAIQGDEGKWQGVRWAEPRKVRRIVVEFGSGPMPDPASVKLQYWHRVWDGKPDPVLAERGAGRVGWDAMDDWTNGSWIDAATQVAVGGNTWSITFASTSDKEIRKLRGPGVSYRKTLQVRLVAREPLSRIERFAVYTDAELKTLQVRIQFDSPAHSGVRLSGDEPGRIEVFNGQVAAVRPLPDQPVQVTTDNQWVLRAGEKGGIAVDLLTAVDPMDPGYDRTIVTVRSSQRPFSFAAAEVAHGDRILVDDLGVLVTRGDDSIALATYRDALRREFSGQTIYDRVEQEPEQTLTRAWNEMPLKRPLYFVHGLPGDRNVVRQQPNGGLEISGRGRWFDIQKSPRDCDRKLWEGNELRLDFGFPEERLRGGCELAEGYLPLLRTWWQDGSIYYESCVVMDALDGKLDDVKLDTPTVLLMRVHVANVSGSDDATAVLRLRSNTARDGRLVVQGDQAVARSEKGPRLRFLVRTDGRGVFHAEDNAARWSADLKPGGAADVFFMIPTITLSEPEEIDALRGRQFGADAKRICDYWRAMAARGTQIHTPEPWLNDYYRAHLLHLLVNCQKELDTDFLHAHVGTFRYGVYPNESVMMISDLDRRGYHDEARRNLDALLHYQGTVSMPGNFRTAEGQFYGAGGHETGGYNKSHGYVLWNMAEHWWHTRDRRWMDAAAPKLVKGCRWVTLERQANLKLSADGTRPLEYGWLPTGSLEDVTDYWHWLSTNAATVWGFLNLADALADFGHPEAGELQKEAKAYRDDFLDGIRRSMVLCPVVRLRDGTYVPKIPSRLYERGRSHGWLRETLEGSVFLPAYDLIPPEAPEHLWILKDFEDNLYISNRFGYDIPNFNSFWFSRGGFSMQANLLDGPLPYLWRDDIKHYLRAYFNSFASAFYPELRMCNEHCLPELGYPAGDHFKTSDEAQSTYWLRLMFVNERGSDLFLGQAIPRYWLADGRGASIERAASRFGPLSLRYEPRVARGEIKVILDPPHRPRPATIYVRIRHPESKPIKGVILNGAAYDRFDPKKDWVVLDGSAEGRQEMVARY